MVSQASTLDRAKREDDVLESRDFYEACQAYRHSQDYHKGMPGPRERFEELKEWIRAHCIVSVDPTVDDKWQRP